MNKQFTIDEVVLHAKPMSLLSHIEEYGDNWLRAQATITSDNIFANIQGVPSWVGIEYMAQAIAAFAGVQAQLNNVPVTIGFLLGTRKYTTSSDYFTLNSTLHITATQIILGENGLGSFECVIESENFNAEASINTFKPVNPDAFLQEN